MGGRQQVGAYLYDGYWLDIGRHDDYEKAITEYESSSTRCGRREPDPQPAVKPGP